MRCKPGDIAIVIHAACRPKHLGTLVEVLERTVHPGIDVCWRVKPLSPHIDQKVKWVAADSSLRPLRDPGDDARDETLDWLPLPGLVGEPA